MSDPCEKSATILLKIRGKTTQFSLYDFAQFSGQNEDAGLYRTKINGRWHCPDGKYTALSGEAVAEMVRALLDGDARRGPQGLRGAKMSEKQYGLSLNEQAHFLCIACRHTTNPEICPVVVMPDVKYPCPFSQKPKTCESVTQDMWYELLKKRVMPMEEEA